MCPCHFWFFSSGDLNLYFSCRTSKRPRRAAGEPRHWTIFCVSRSLKHHSSNSVWKINIKSTEFLNEFPILTFCCNFFLLSDQTCFEKAKPCKANLLLGNVILVQLVFVEDGFASELTRAQVLSMGYPGPCWGRRARRQQRSWQLYARSFWKRRWLKKWTQSLWYIYDTKATSSNVNLA